MAENSEEEQLISYFSGGNTGFTDFTVYDNGEGEYFNIEAGIETQYEFNLDMEEAEEYRDQLWNSVTNESAIKQGYNTSVPAIELRRDDESRTGKLTSEGKEVLNEMINAFEENKK